MAHDRLEVSRLLGASPEQVFDAFLDGSKHSAMTGAPATASTDVGGRFTAWDGYIEGENVSLERPRRIVQRWRASDFPEGAGSSLLDIRLEPDGDGTRLTIVHDELPEGTAGRFTEGWEQFYFEPMSVYFGEKLESDEPIGHEETPSDEEGDDDAAEDPAESLREAAKAEDEDDEEVRSERSEVDGAIRSLWEQAALGEVKPTMPTETVKMPIIEDDDESDDDLRIPTQRIPRHAALVAPVEDLDEEDDLDDDEGAMTITVDDEDSGLGSVEVTAADAARAKLARKAPAKKAAKKAPARKAARKTAKTAKKSAAKKASAKKTAKKSAKKSAAKKAPAKKTAKKSAKKSAASKAPAKKTAKKSAKNRKTAKKSAAKKAPAKKSAAKKTARKSASRKNAPARKKAAKKRGRR